MPTSAGDATAAAKIRGALARHGRNQVYREGDAGTTLADHLASAGRMAAALRRDFGVGPGDRVAVLAATSRTYIALWHAALLGHFVIVPLNTRLTASELRPILANAEPAVLVHDDGFRDLASAAGGTAALRTIALADLAAADIEPLPMREDVVADETAAILYTTGTTGIPKGATLTQAALAATEARQHAYWDIRSPGTRYYTTTPLYHVSAIPAVLGPVLHGHLSIVTPAYDVDRLLHDSRALKLTHLAVVALMVDRLLDHPEFRSEEHRHIRYLVYGGSPIPWPTIERMRRLLPDTRLVQCYGMTEALGASTALPDEDHLAEGSRLLSCGRALPGVEIVALDGDGRPCGPGETGELAIRSDGLMRGYWRNAEATAAALADGLFRSGDVGYLDADGYVHVVDRLKDMIITGGENVYSVEVERAIARLPHVAQVAVIGMPDRIWGEAVHAVVVPEPGATLEPAGMLAALRRDLAGYKCPKTLDIRTRPLPMAGNKVSKLLLRQEYADMQGNPANG